MGTTETGTTETGSMAGAARTPHRRCPRIGKVCPRCGRTYPPEFAFCQDDATPLDQTGEREPEETDGQGEVLAAEDGETREGGERADLPDARAALDRKLLIAGAVGLTLMAGVALLSAARHPAPPRFYPAASAVATPAIPSPAAGQSDRRTAEGDAGDGGSQVGSVTRWQTYQNEDLGFRMDCPAGWTAELPARDGASVFVLLHPPQPHRNILVYVDRPGHGGDPLGRWRRYDAHFTNVYAGRYHGLGVTAATLGGEAAARWAFTLQRKGQPELEKVDVGATHAGSDYALLCEAPPSEFAGWRDAFAHVAESFAWIR